MENEAPFEESITVSGHSFAVRIDPVTAVGDPIDHYREVEVRAPTGERYLGVFFLDPQGGKGPRGKIYWDDPTMILIHSLSLKSVRDGIEQILISGSLREAMEVK